MKKLILAAAALVMVPQASWAQGAAPVDYTFLAECAAVYSVKAEETAGKLPPDYTENFYQVAATFYDKAMGGGNDMKIIYKQKLGEFKNASDTVTKQYKRALEKQCAAAAPDHDIKIMR